MGKECYRCAHSPTWRDSKDTSIKMCYLHWREVKQLDSCDDYIGWLTRLHPDIDKRVVGGIRNV